MPLKFALVAEGDAETPACWSGCAQGFVHALRRAGHTVSVVDVEVRGWRRYALAARSWHPDRERWRQQFLMGRAAFEVRTASAARAARIIADADVVVQVGATFRLPPGTVPGLHVIYADANAVVARSAAMYSEVGRLPDSTFAEVRAREQQVYAQADAIWTFSSFLSTSFAQDFSIPEDRISVVYAGANPHAIAANTSPAEWPRARRVLFVGRQARRKGLELLLEAFGDVRRRVPDAQLDIVGPPRTEPEAAGVTHHGALRANVPDEAAVLRELYRSAAVFCMPSHYEPFGVVFAEAMLAGLPCIGTNRWAMPEIIEDGVTGLTTPAGDAAALADALVRVLSSPASAEAMGTAGRERALTLFTWNAVASRAVADAETRLRQRAAPR